MDQFTPSPNWAAPEMQSAPAQFSPAPEPAPKRSKRWLVILFIGLLLAGGAAAAYFFYVEPVLLNSNSSANTNTNFNTNVTVNGVTNTNSGDFGTFNVNSDANLNSSLNTNEALNTNTTNANASLNTNATTGDPNSITDPINRLYVGVCYFRGLPSTDSYIPEGFRDSFAVLIADATDSSCAGITAAETNDVISLLQADADSDGLNAFFEVLSETDDTKADTDGDGYNDLDEINNGYDPTGPGKLQL